MKTSFAQAIPAITLAVSLVVSLHLAALAVPAKAQICKWGSKQYVKNFEIQTECETWIQNFSSHFVTNNLVDTARNAKHFFERLPNGNFRRIAYYPVEESKNHFSKTRFYDEREIHECIRPEDHRIIRDRSNEPSRFKYYKQQIEYRTDAPKLSGSKFVDCEWGPKKVIKTLQVQGDCESFLHEDQAKEIEELKLDVVFDTDENGNSRRTTYFNLDPGVSAFWTGSSGILQCRSYNAETDISVIERQIQHIVIELPKETCPDDSKLITTPCRLRE